MNSEGLNSATKIADGVDLWDSTNKKFNHDAVKALKTALFGSADADAAAYIKSNYDADEKNNYSGAYVVPATTINSGITDTDKQKYGYIVKLGGLDWIVASLTLDNSNNPVVTLYLADDLTDDAGDVVKTQYYSDSTNVKGNNMYSRSILRNNIKSETGDYAKLALFDKTNAETNSDFESKYLVQPKNIAYQLNQTMKDRTATIDQYNLFNDSLKEPTNGAWLWGEFPYAFGDTYLDPNGNAVRYDAWGEDYIWVPSLTETGCIDAFGTYPNKSSIWKLNAEQLKHTDSTCFLRSGTYSAFNDLFALGYDSYSTGGSVTFLYNVRPAIHLNLNAAAALKLLPVPTTDPVEVEYAGDKIDFSTVSWYDPDIFDDPTLAKVEITDFRGNTPDRFPVNNNIPPCYYVKITLLTDDYVWASGDSTDKARKGAVIVVAKNIDVDFKLGEDGRPTCSVADTSQICAGDTVNCVIGYFDKDKKYLGTSPTLTALETYYALPSFDNPSYFPKGFTMEDMLEFVEPATYVNAKWKDGVDSKTYGGSPLTFELDCDLEMVTITAGDGITYTEGEKTLSATNAGTYTVSLNLKDTTGCVWGTDMGSYSGTRDPVEMTFTITKATPTITPSAENISVVEGNAYALTGAASNGEKVTIAYFKGDEEIEGAPTAAGSYTAKLSVAETDNYFGAEISVPITISAHEHIYGEYTYNNDATCTEDGTETAYCTFADCTESTTRTKTGTALGHDYVYTYNNDATCTENGTETGTCSRCGDKISREKEDTALGHNYVYTYNNDATCLADGTETGTCSRCGGRDTRAKAGTKLEHSYILNHDANVHWMECKNGCHDKKDYGAHKYEIAGEITKPATETEEGEQIYSCVCGAETTKKLPVSPPSTVKKVINGFWNEAGDVPQFVTEDSSKLSVTYFDKNESVVTELKKGETYTVRIGLKDSENYKFADNLETQKTFTAKTTAKVDPNNPNAPPIPVTEGEGNSPSDAFIEALPQITISGIALALIVVFTVMTLNYAAATKIVLNKTKRLAKSTYSFAPVGLLALALGISGAGWWAIAGVLTVIAIVMGIVAFLFRGKKMKALALLEEEEERVAEEKEAARQAQARDEQIRRDNRLKKMFEALQQNIQQPINYEAIQGMISSTVSALLPAMQQQMALPPAPSEATPSAQSEIERLNAQMAQQSAQMAAQQELLNQILQNQQEESADDISWLGSEDELVSLEDSYGNLTDEEKRCYYEIGSYIMNKPRTSQNDGKYAVLFKYRRKTLFKLCILGDAPVLYYPSGNGGRGEIRILGSNLDLAKSLIDRCMLKVDNELN